MNTEEIARIVADQRAYFRTHATFDVDARRRALVRLRDTVRAHEDDIARALKTDLGKSHDEAYMCEIGTSLSEIRHQIAHVARWSCARLHPCDLANAISVCKTQPVPYGVTLIMAPWNYPFLLTLEPLAGALAAGNTVVIKPSAYAPASSAVLRQICEEAFDPRLVTVVEGGRAENVPVGKLVMERASKNLTPVTLELGGKSPCIVDASANLKVAARRIAFGKWLNVGQTCVAPDHLLVDARVHDELLELIKEEVRHMFGEHPLDNENYGHIVNAKHFARVRGLIDPDKVVLGGTARETSLKIEPTILDGVTPEDAVMQEEIFGPILPVLTFESLDEVEAFIVERPTPLALYIFSQDRAVQKRFVRYVPFGGGCVNDTIMHLATSHMGFGGMGASGMGQYHGRESFDTFSHKKSIVNKATWLDVPFRYAPYASWKHKFVRMFVH